MRHRDYVGGLWEKLGLLQLEFMVEQGLRPNHTLLDIGCGSLRFGARVIPYLDAFNYYGIDREDWLVTAGLEKELPEKFREERSPTVIVDSHFDFKRFGETFDFAIAQSVFTHLPWNAILLCLYNLKPYLKPEGAFYATFFEVEDYQEESVWQADSIFSHTAHDPFHYPFWVFEQLAERLDYKADYIGDWDHPRNQKMMVFTHA